MLLLIFLATYLRRPDFNDEAQGQDGGRWLQTEWRGRRETSQKALLPTRPTVVNQAQNADFLTDYLMVARPTTNHGRRFLTLRPFPDPILIFLSLGIILILILTEQCSVRRGHGSDVVTSKGRSIVALIIHFCCSCLRVRQLGSVKAFKSKVSTALCIPRSPYFVMFFLVSCAGPLWL